ncbi:MAG: DUF1499 domain-containing protein [Candidatus Hydrogenedentes bacterium]|nr:DUF1499 domain-containing protein [Candidatus Hydrogenedentota bacterium]
MTVNVVSAVPLLVLLAGVILAHTGVLSPLTGYATFLLSVPLGLITTTLVVVGRSKGIVRTGTVPATMSMMPLVLVAAAASPGFRLPHVNDVTTDTANPPRYAKAAEIPQNMGRNLDFPAANASRISAGYPDLKPLRVDLTSRDVYGVYNTARALAGDWEGWTITYENPEQGIIEGYAESFFFRFRDDITIRIVQHGDEAIVDMRSKSRVGKHDYGANARRIRNYLRSMRNSLGLPH